MPAIGRSGRAASTHGCASAQGWAETSSVAFDGGFAGVKRCEKPTTPEAISWALFG